MAADIGQIAQLLNATLDPSQHRQGKVPPDTATLRCPAVTTVDHWRFPWLINKSPDSRKCSQAGNFETAVLIDTAQYRGLRLYPPEHPTCRFARLQELHPLQLCGTPTRSDLFHTASAKLL